MGLKSPSAPAAVINSPQASSGGRQAPAGSGTSASGAVGTMSKADMSGAMDGKPTDGLAGAVSHLKSLG